MIIPGCEECQCSLRLWSLDDHASNLDADGQGSRRNREVGEGVRMVPSQLASSKGGCRKEGEVEDNPHRPPQESQRSARRREVEDGSDAEVDSFQYRHEMREADEEVDEGPDSRIVAITLPSLSVGIVGEDIPSGEDKPQKNRDQRVRPGEMHPPANCFIPEDSEVDTEFSRFLFLLDFALN